MYIVHYGFIFVFRVFFFFLFFFFSTVCSSKPLFLSLMDVWLFYYSLNRAVVHFWCPVRTALREACRREAPLRTPPLRLRVFLVRGCCFFGFGNLVFQLWLTAEGCISFGIPLTVRSVEKWVCAQIRVPCRKNLAAAWCVGRGCWVGVGWV